MPFLVQHSRLWLMSLIFLLSQFTSSTSDESKIWGRAHARFKRYLACWRPLILFPSFIRVYSCFLSSVFRFLRTAFTASSEDRARGLNAHGVDGWVWFDFTTVAIGNGSYKCTIAEQTNMIWNDMQEVG